MVGVSEKNIYEVDIAHEHTPRVHPCKKLFKIELSIQTLHFKQTSLVRLYWQLNKNLVIDRPTSQQFHNYLCAGRELLKKLCKIYLKLGTIFGTSNFALISPFTLSPNFKVKRFLGLQISLPQITPHPETSDGEL